VYVGVLQREKKLHSQIQGVMVFNIYVSGFSGLYSLGKSYGYRVYLYVYV
jgi:hypothetical protein